MENRRARLRWLGWRNWLTRRLSVFSGSRNTRGLRSWSRRCVRLAGARYPNATPSGILELVPSRRAGSALLIADSSAENDAIRECLEHSGYSVVVAESSGDGFETARIRQPFRSHRMRFYISLRGRLEIRRGVVARRSRVARVRLPSGSNGRFRSRASITARIFDSRATGKYFTD